MHVVLPELDGRVLQGVVAFKGPLPAPEGLCFSALGSVPEPDRVAMWVDRVAALVRLKSTPRAQRRAAVLLPDYPGAAGRSGYAVGLDVPASVVALLSDLGEANYDVGDAPGSSRALLDLLAVPSNDALLPLERYRALVAGLPVDAMERVRTAWGEPENDGDVRDGAFRFRAHAFGNIVVAFPPERGRATDRRAEYHDATLPPRHALLAFGLWLRHVARMDAVIHMGAHGTLEWLPGKAVGLTA
jgi:cobaltochelatase CobN